MASANQSGIGDLVADIAGEGLITAGTAPKPVFGKRFVDPAGEALTLGAFREGFDQSVSVVGTNSLFQRLLTLPRSFTPCRVVTFDCTRLRARAIIADVAKTRFGVTGKSKLLSLEELHRLFSSCSDDGSIPGGVYLHKDSESNVFGLHVGKDRCLVSASWETPKRPAGRAVPGWVFNAFPMNSHQMLPTGAKIVSVVRSRIFH